MLHRLQNEKWAGVVNYPKVLFKALTLLVNILYTFICAYVPGWNEAKHHVRYLYICSLVPGLPCTGVIMQGESGNFLCVSRHGNWKGPEFLEQKGNILNNRPFPLTSKYVRNP